MEGHEKLLETYKRLVETKLGWGSSELWTNQDYEKLSLKIFDATGVNLSAATLKRIWGKVRYDSKPTTTTLNTLAKFAGYESWRDFAMQYLRTRAEADPIDEEGRAQTAKAPGYRKVFYILIALVIVAAGAYAIYIFVAAGNKDQRNKRAFEFSSKKVVSEGVPNTVVFDYDASEADEYDTIYVQQSWDPRLRTKVLPSDRQHTSVYYHPGFFQAKLVVNQEVVREHPLFIKTNGWLPMIDTKPVPVYLNGDDVRRNGKLQVSIEQLRENNIPLQPLPAWTSFYFVNDFDIKDDSIFFETNLKNDYSEGAAICQNTEIHLLFEGRALVVPLSAPGCVAELNFLHMEGTKHDLSALGVDFKKWVNVKVELVNQAGKVTINDSVSLEVRSISPAARFVGILYRFQGVGSVDDVRVGKSRNEILFSEDFN